MVSDCEPGCEESRTTYQLEVEREHDGVRLWTRMWREQEDALPGGGERAWWCQIVDPDAKRAEQCTLWRQRRSRMVSDCGPECEESRKTYFLEVERERNGVRLWTQMQREQDDIPTRGEEGAWWCQIEDADARRTGQHTSWRWRGSVMASNWGRRCEESRTTYELEVKEHDGVRLWRQMQRKQDDILPGGGEEVWWCQIEDADVKRVGQHMNWRWRSVMVSDWGPGCEESRRMYFLEAERESDGVWLWTWMQREHDNVLPGDGEGAWWCQIEDVNAKRAGDATPFHCWCCHGCCCCSCCWCLCLPLLNTCNKKLAYKF